MDHARTLEGLLDKAEITDLIHAYCYHFDRAEVQEVVALFAEDAVIDYGPDVPTMTGSDEFGPMIARGLADLFEATSHHVSNVVIQFDDPNAATSICYLYAWHRYRDGGQESKLWGQYHHDFVRTEAGWRISRLVLRATGTKDFHRANMHPIGRRDSKA